MFVQLAFGPYYIPRAAIHHVLCKQVSLLGHLPNKQEDFQRLFPVDLSKEIKKLDLRYPLSCKHIHTFDKKCALKSPWYCQWRLPVLRQRQVPRGHQGHCTTLWSHPLFSSTSPANILLHPNNKNKKTRKHLSTIDDSGLKKVFHVLPPSLLLNYIHFCTFALFLIKNIKLIAPLKCRLHLSQNRNIN